MKQYLAFLRGINVGGKNKILMKDLISLFQSNNFKDVKTYIQSGNLVFNSTVSDPVNLAETMRKLILDQYGLQIEVLIRTREEQTELVRFCETAFNPQSEGKSWSIAYLDKKATRGGMDCLSKWLFQDEKLRLFKNHVLMYFPYGIAKTKVTIDRIERCMNCKATVRNWNTTLKMLVMLDGWPDKKNL